MELLIDQVVVTDKEVEIRYVVPTSPDGPHHPFCHLRTDYLPLLPLLALGWHLGKDERLPTQTSASPSEEEPSAQRGYSGQPVDQDDRSWRRRARLRWWEKGKG